MGDMQRVGAEISAADRWRERGSTYAEGIHDAYHAHRLEVIRALLPPLRGLDVVDFGCGEGVLIREAKNAGAKSIIGTDIDAGMLKLAEDAGANRLLLGSVRCLDEIEQADCIIAANVAAYFTADENGAFTNNAAAS
jgi:2-polyprenyl-3-methyl-5-hydroxy-6-metoxy-1,4-benzoquinol methylase